MPGKNISHVTSVNSDGSATTVQSETVDTSSALNPMPMNTGFQRDATFDSFPSWGLGNALARGNCIARSVAGGLVWLST